MTQATFTPGAQTIANVTQAAQTTTLQPNTQYPSPTPIPYIDWEQIPGVNSIIKSIQALGDNPILLTVIVSLTTLLFTQIGKIFRAIRKFSTWIWHRAGKYGKDYAFERAYFDWLIGHNLHIGLLPAQTVA